MTNLLTQAESALLLRVKSRTLAAWRQRGKGPRYVKVGSAVRYTLDDVQEYLAARKRQQTEVAHG